MKRRKRIPYHPRLTLQEVKDVSAAVYDVIFRNANQKSFSPDEVRRYYDLCITEQLTARTVNISFIEVDDCTFNLVHELQRLLVANYPAWVIRIAGSSEDTTIAIDTHAIRYGLHQTNENSKDEMELFTSVLCREARARGDKYNAAKAQRDVLTEKFRSVIHAGFVGPFVVAVGFDNYEGDFTQTPLWTLYGKNIGNLELMSPEDSMARDHMSCQKGRGPWISCI